MDRAYAVLEVKSIDAGRRVFSGLASTPTLDRQGHSVDPAGVTFRNPVPLLLYHDQTKPIGTATLTKTPEGIWFEAEIPAVLEPGRLRDRADEAWQSIKAGVMRGTSIGYRVIGNAIEALKGGGLRLKRTEIFELSLVTIPANVEASILNVKHYAAAPGQSFSGAAGISRGNMQPVNEQISLYENSRAASSARMAELMAGAAAGSRTLEDEETTEYDGLAAKVKSIDAHLVRLRAMESSQVAAAAPASGVMTIGGLPVVRVKSNLAPATAFIRYCQAIAYGRGNRAEAVEFSKQWKDTTPEVELLLKAAVAPGTTTDATWAGPLAALQPLTSEFLELLRPATILGRIPGLKSVPFNISIVSQTGGGTYAWVGQGAPKPVGKLQFGSVTLGITKAAGIIIITEELARVSNPSAESVIRADMIAGMSAFLDVEFTDPTKAAVANVSPGSVTNGVTPITTAGTTPANARTDILALLSALTTAGHSARGAVILMSETNAMALGGAVNAFGQPVYPGIGPGGGTILGVSLVTSQAMGTTVAALAPEAILVADDGGVNIDASREASVQMDSAPDNPALATTVLTSLWQNNLVGLRAERFINWKKARAGCVQYTVATYAAA